MSKIPTIFETKWPTVLLSPISVSNHIIAVSSTVGLHPKQVVTLKKAGVLSENFIIQRILSDTELQIGKMDVSFIAYENPTQFDGGSLEMLEQERNKMGSEIYFRAVYEERPVALRTILVDRYGQHYTSANPVPIIGEISVSSIPDVSIKNLNSDAFGRTRVSELFTLGDYKHVDGIDKSLIDKALNGGSVNASVNKSCVTLTTTSNLNSYAAHQTKAYHHYQPGKSQLIFSSVCFGYAQKNVTKRTGYFDDRDGIYFEQIGSNASDGTNNGQLNFVIRSSTSGIPSESNVGSYLRRVPQNLWNKDKCDGTGPSGFNLDTSKTMLVYIDFQWLGVGRVRVGFVHDGITIIAHEYYHTNILETVYMTNPNLPVRCEIFNTGETLGGAMDQICSSVASEGGYTENGIDWAIHSLQRVTASPSGTPLPLIAIRLKNTFNSVPNRIGVKLNSISFYVETNSIVYELIKLPNASTLSTTLNGGVLIWNSASSDSGVEYCVNATNCNAINPDQLLSGFVPSGSSQNSLSPVASGAITSAKKNVIYQNFDSTNSEVYLIMVRTIIPSGNQTASVSAAVQWREIY